jgi:hypothetical protein
MLNGLGENKFGQEQSDLEDEKHFMTRREHSLVKVMEKTFIQQ